MHPNLTTPPVERLCTHCGQPFRMYPSEERRGRVFCSLPCAYADRTRSPEVRFWEKVHKSDSCWLWQGKRNWAGYGCLYLNGIHVFAHRFSYELHHGPIPEGMIVCHRCDNPSCVRPDHLFVGSHGDNMRDMVAKGRHAPITPAQRQSMTEGLRASLREHPERIPRGEKRGQVKLTEEQVKAIRIEYAAGGINQKALGAKYGVSQGLITCIVTRKKWAHVP